MKNLMTARGLFKKAAEISSAAGDVSLGSTMILGEGEGRRAKEVGRASL